MASNAVFFQKRKVFLVFRAASMLYLNKKYERRCAPWRAEGTIMLKVFLIEDESIVREGLRDNIPWEEYGFVLAGEASDGEMALPMIRKIKPDILITDIKMPFMDGLEISRIVSRELPNTKIIIISGYDDFKFAQQAIEVHVDQYLVKPVLRVPMIRALEQTKRRIEEEQEQHSFLRKYSQETREYEHYSRRIFFEHLTDGSLSAAEARRQARDLDINLEAAGYNLVLFTLQPGVAKSEYSESVAMLYDELIQDLLRRPEQILFRWNLFSYAVLIKGDKQSQAELTRRCVDTIQRRCEMTTVPLDWYVAVGIPVATLEELPACFAQVNHLLSLRHMLQGQHVLTQEAAAAYPAEGRSQDLIDSGPFDPMVLRSFIQSGMKNEIDGFTSDLMDKLGEALRSMLFRHYLMVSVRINAIAALQTMGCSTEPLELPPMAIDMGDEQLRVYIARVLELALQIRDDESQKQNSSIIENAIKFIDQNYSDESISLNVVAKAINISANYLSAVFSHKMGISFVEYLTQKRMDKAKHLLRNTGKRSGEIAYEVGYKDPRYFSFVFKKTQGCTPRNYRAGEKNSK